jgi:hypothetical protein
VRKALRVKGGDSVLFEFDKGKVTIRRDDTLDRAFLKLAERAFEEWNSPEDEAAFRDLISAGTSWQSPSLSSKEPMPSAGRR